MKELSLNILDIAKNSVKAGADLITIQLNETDETLEIRIEDNGCGMTRDFLATVTDPFTTTRKTRSVGLGIPFFKLACEQTGGRFYIDSRAQAEFPQDHGTVIGALFNKNHIDFTPLGDVISSVVTLIQADPDIHWVYTHILPGKTVALDTDELKAVLGDVPLSHPEVIQWMSAYLAEQYADEAQDNES